LRRILKISHTAHQTDKSIWAKITESAGPQEHLLAAVKRSTMRWFGHVNRSTGLAEVIMRGSVDVGRSREWPITSWLDNIKI